MAAAALGVLLSKRRVSVLFAARRVFPRPCRLHGTLTMDLIENMHKKETWDCFYQQGGASSSPLRPFEWFFGYPAVSELLLSFLEPGPGPEGPARVLDLGCGTSDLGPGLYRDSARAVRVTCADVSPVAVQLLRRRLAERPPRPGHPGSLIRVLELDGAAELVPRLGPRTLDLLLDKGTTDALLRSGGGAAAGRCLQQSLGALRLSGSLLQFSDEDPDARLPWLEREGRGAPVRLQELGALRGVSYYCYIISPPSQVTTSETNGQ